ncbi:alpha/beta hydrolase [Curtobacterium flaccumfaciens pv. flaccumfaciens]|uniref:alpha/beta fold hydrolase n=1 Tax=Curtobacterium flaccumfaciens TaxID=2035 RepID=UPI001BDDDCC7|nr:alpha/beta hydrolase [Curtobacterium flaccumfaciens]MBT1669134.1 alpha/beta hydrolase [Curtobacterium flaccumfaciens pv. flaccumfaciens]
MSTDARLPIDTAPRLAFDDSGAPGGHGAPDAPVVVLLHGLTFDRTTWGPIVERLAPRYRVIAFDLPAHGDTGGTPVSNFLIACQVHTQLDELHVVDPVIVGHSMSGTIAALYAAHFPVAGAVSVDQVPDIRPLVPLATSIDRDLSADDFARAFAPMQAFMRLENLPSSSRQLVERAQARNARPATVFGYWDQLLGGDVDELQAAIDHDLRRVTAPVLAVFGHLLTLEEHSFLDTRFTAPIELVELEDAGHFVHLARADDFSAVLTAFIDRVTS